MATNYSVMENEHWINEQVKGMDEDEKNEFLDECKDFILYLDKYSTKKRFFKHKRRFDYD